MKKVLIQVVSVITLVFGTCYQSVLALADDRERTELSGVQLSDSQGNRPNQVKVNEKNELEMTITINNKDGENKKGEVNMWLPESQLKVLQRKVKAESAVPDTKATLIYEKRKNQQPHLTWRHVDTSATFKLKLPVEFTATMTSMALPIAVDTQREYLQPLTVVDANTKDEDLAQAGTATGLPADITQSLTSFIEAQKAQQAQQAAQEAQQAQDKADAQQAQEAQDKEDAQKTQEAQDKEDAKQPEQNAESKAPAKDENEEKAKDAAKEDAAKEEAEAKRDAEKKAEQEAADKQKEDEKTADTLDKNPRAATAESKKDGVEREGNDEEAEPTDLGQMLEDKHGTAGSLFNSVSIERDGVTTGILTHCWIS
ncbi:adhesive domain-containing protein [Secundilactobacillus hailunensis]|uniref:Adhesive domain-containing protein n=1 Tax=Secundilactobacillus hailunensis TaxID=2559923 RepID=A0ABW1T8U3_9LACO|nr:adhesive domain-containing protein [Secundilactobacillus hailunensis]